MWIFALPIISGVFEAANRNIMKLSKAHTLVLLSLGYLFTVPFYVVWLWVEGIPKIGPNFWWAVFFHVPLWSIAMILTIEAHRRSPFILTAPYLALTPAFLLVSSPLMGGGYPTRLGVLGVLFVTFGVYFLNVKEGQNGILDPFIQIGKEKGSLFMLFVALIGAVVTNLDFIALKNANGPFYVLIDGMLMALVSVILILIYWQRGKIETSEFSIKSFWPFFLFGFFLFGAVFFHMTALKFIQNVPYEIAGKRTGVILATVGSGLILASLKRFQGKFKEEKEQLGYRLFGVGLIVAGMLIIILRG